VDVSFGFERRVIRGMNKVWVKMVMAFVVILDMALGSIDLGQPYRMRSLVWSTEIRRATYGNA
jgi:hypothetical protein